MALKLVEEIAILDEHFVDDFGGQLLNFFVVGDCHQRFTNDFSDLLVVRDFMDELIMLQERIFQTLFLSGRVLVTESNRREPANRIETAT